MAAVRGHHCADCGGHRLHAVRKRTEAGGKVVRVRVCSACEHTTPLLPAETPGVCCRKCGDCRLGVYSTRHTAAGVTVRIRRCLFCGNKIKTREEVMSHAV